MSIKESFCHSLRSQFGNEAESVFADSESLQRKAQDKFGEPVDGGSWWVTQRALQQSTPWQVARLKAAWFADAPVADLCCGIGGDSMWLAQRGPLVAVDFDPMMVRIAEANCQTAGLAMHTASLEAAVGAIDEFVHAEFVHAEFVHAEAVSFARTWSGAVHVDPDRRSGMKRTSAPDYYVPAWSDVVGVLQLAPAGIVKLAPAADLDASVLSRPSHRTWISLRGSVREQSLLVGDALTKAQLPHDARSAIAIRGDGSFRPFSIDAASEIERRAMIASEPGDWMVDPDAAIRAAGLTDAFANANGLRVIGSPSGFLTTVAGSSGLGTAELNAGCLGLAHLAQVEWSGPCDERKLKKEMRSRGVYPAVVKIRGVDRDPVKVARTFRDCGDRPVTLWLGSIGKKVYAAITDGAGDSSKRVQDST